MLESFPQEIFVAICKNLSIYDIHKLASVNNSMQNSIINNNFLWKSLFERNFPHLIEEVTRKGEPRNWYTTLKNTYIDEYGLNEGDMEGAYRKAALFSAAKNGNALKFKKLYEEELKRLSSSPTNTLPLSDKNHCDKNKYRCYDWLYQNGHQAILDDIFINSDQSFEFVILCNQQDYLKKNEEKFKSLIQNHEDALPYLTSAIQLGSLSLVKLLLEIFDKIPLQLDMVFHICIKHAVRYNRLEIVEFFHEKSRSINKNIYAATLYESLQTAIESGRKKIFAKLLAIYDEKQFTVNHPGPSSLLYSATLKNDPDYATMLLEKGSNHTPNGCESSSIAQAVSAGNYETLIVLLKNDVHKYLKCSDIQSTLSGPLKAPDLATKLACLDHQYLKEWLSQIPLNGEPSMRALADLICYQYEQQENINTFSKLSSSFSTLFPSTSSNTIKPTSFTTEKTVEHKICDVLLDVLTRKCPTTALDELHASEKDELNNEACRLNIIYQNLLSKIQEIREKETLEKTYQSINLHSPD